MTTLAFWESKKGFKKFNPDRNCNYPCYWQTYNKDWMYIASSFSVPVMIRDTELLPKEIQLYLLLES